MRSSRKRGFTTLETMTVVVMFGTVAAIAGPKLYANYTATMSRTDADRLARAAELARATAVRFGRDAELRIDATNKKFWVQVDTTTNLTGVKDTVGIVNSLGDTKVSMAMTLGGTSASTAVVCFDVRGIRSARTPCQSGEAMVDFTMSTYANRVQITTLGKVIR